MLATAPTDTTHVDRLLELTERAQAHHFWYHGFRSYIRPVLADVAAGRTNLRIVDCACGTGHNLELLAPYGHPVGFDLTIGGLAHARARGRAVARADIRRAPFPSDFFDLATSFDVMQCTEHDQEGVREMARVLKPGGVAVISMAAFELLRGDHSEQWQEFRRYTPATARHLAEQAGLRVERVQFLFAALVPLMLAVRGMQRLLRPVRSPRVDADIAVPSAPVNDTLAWVLRQEAALAKRIAMPFGSSLLVVARKP
jgi:SAM-dependent methyltransferase